MDNAGGLLQQVSVEHRGNFLLKTLCGIRPISVVNFFISMRADQNDSILESQSLSLNPNVVRFLIF